MIIYILPIDYRFALLCFALLCTYGANRCK